MNEHPIITWTDFEKVDMRVGTIIRTEAFPEARNPAFKVWIDLGDLGQKQSSAQITVLYDQTELVGRQVIAVVNFPVKQIGPFMSECLILGAYSDAGVVLLQPERRVRDGSRIG